MATFRERIIGLARSLNLSREQFTVGPFIDWPAIQKRIESRFVMKTRSDLSPLEWPEHFKGKQQVIKSQTFEPYEYLDELLPVNEIFWLLLPDSAQEQKLWLFQGYIRPIQKVLSQLPKTSFYVVAKKYEWLLFNDRKDEFTALGELPEKPESYKEPEAETLPPEQPEEEN
ncbi:DUF6756 family protein [Adhaeribacter soli]|uniref:Uncharacterized protein n=1 Tax=Adhaeribacter soli TaxID=2607655 RepID=A0A5N1J258_9BACT|nr:DUF6756 family protein [Adhaeribacter soli]KAA9340828.1 hypothetical protein F0P94_05210 [Adhaeribacter soli]